MLHRQSSADQGGHSCSSSYHCSYDTTQNSTPQTAGFDPSKIYTTTVAMTTTQNSTAGFDPSKIYTPPATTGYPGATPPYP